MKAIAITYASGAGHTERLAELIAQGCEAVDFVLPLIFDVENLNVPDWQALEKSDAIVFGAPTYMGSIAAPFKAFMDQTSDFWAAQTWANKIAAGFTVGTYPSGDKLASLQQMSVFAAQHGMLWVGQGLIGPPAVLENGKVNTNGSWLGLAATSSRNKKKLIRKSDAKTARAFGQRIATVTRLWQG